MTIGAAAGPKTVDLTFRVRGLRHAERDDYDGDRHAAHRL